MRRACAAASVVCLLFARGAVASGGGWSGQASDDPYGQGSQLNGVSCSSPDACTAVGAWSGPGAMAERWNGSSWSDQPTWNRSGAYPDLEGVSCPTADVCTAVGRSSASPYSTYSLAERWSGGKWRFQNTPSPPTPGAVDLRSVSCASASVCVAVGRLAPDNHVKHTPLAELWDGSKWTIQRVPGPAGTSSYLELNGVSCASTSACTAVGSTGPHAGQLIERWNGRLWSVQRPARPGAGKLFGVSCASANACVAVGEERDQALLELWNGRRWSIMSAPRSSGWPISVSCTSANACTAVGRLRYAERWNGKRWRVQRTSDNQDFFDGVSCPTLSDCTAVGYTAGGSYSFTLIEHWTG
jgi:hypothetical protein